MLGAVFFLLVGFYFCLPEPLFKKPTSFVVESRKGELLSASIASDGQWRFPQSDSIPDKFKKCIIAFEDKRFYNHPGIDFLSIARAVKQNLQRKRIVSGGSTLSMQVIRLSDANKRTLANKILEALRALRLECRYSKDEILSLYAANAPFGTNVVGLEAASWRYYGRSPHQLSWGETAALAVLPNSPSLVHPGRNRERLKQKRNRLIDALQQQDILTKEEAGLAKLEPVPDKPLALPEDAPHLLGLLKKDYKKHKILTTRIKSSLESALQKQTSSILSQHQKQLSANQINNCAALILDVETGEALAYCGNLYQPKNADIESHVDVIQAPRSPGSTLKPLLYAAMMNEGMLLPHSLVPDIPTQIAGYQPNNFDLGYDGAVPASKALARSLNVPAVKMLQQYRYERFHGLLRGMGISTLNNPPDFYGLSLILGGCETRMWELAGVYASMARSLNHFRKNKGQYLDGDWRMPSYLSQAMPIESDLSKHGKLNASAIYYTFQAMNELMRPGEELLWKRFASSQAIAWKTGTSFGFRDGWAIGITPRFVVAVWVGNTDGEGRPGLTGIDAAAPILFDIFRLLPAPVNGPFELPLSEMRNIEVCTESGYKASDVCTFRKTMPLPEACLKAPACNFHQLIHLDKNGQYQVNSDCESPSNMVHKSWFVLPPAMEYYFKTKNFSYRPLPPFRMDCQSSYSAAPAMELIYPKPNAKIYVPIGIDGKREQVIFNAAHRNQTGKIFWHLDNRFAGTTQEIHQLALHPGPGRHIITLVDAQGNRLEQAFMILDKEKN